MKIIKDERLQLQNLKNIRIAFIVQTVGVLAILLYETVTEGFTAAKENPVWLVFMLSAVVLGWLNLTISVDEYDDANPPKKLAPYYQVVIIPLVVGAVVTLLALYGPDKSSFSEAILIGAVVFVCFLATFTFVYFLRKKRAKDRE
ncbi:hypothetical protein ABE096_13395 [Robertmurraya massiliosenegalensis]|uniref:hypothetical protein n=1 Tax=Robertmurraya TaxID=2837507 RepID=UPI0039A744A3